MTFPTWFSDHGIGVFPLIGSSKVPACRSWDDFTCTRAEAEAFRSYGVRLGRVAVADSDTPEAENWLAGNLPATPFKVKNSRGWHRYYRLTSNDLPKFIHRDGLTIEFRHRGQYVVGPGSRHHTGIIYSPSDWSWDWKDIPAFPCDFCFDDRPRAAVSAGFAIPDALYESERHDGLYRIMRSLVARGVPLEGALKACLLENETRCRPPLANLRELDSFLRRAYHQPDHSDFERSSDTGWVLAGNLLEIGLSVPATIAAVKSVTPDFDPEEQL